MSARQMQHDLLETAEIFPRVYREEEGGLWWSQWCWGGVTTAGSGMAGGLLFFSASALGGESRWRPPGRA